MFQTYQRYNFESKSQREVLLEIAQPGCFRPTKDTILRANHNAKLVVMLKKQVFQTYQRYNFESKSQLIQDLEFAQLGVSDLPKIQF